MQVLKWLDCRAKDVGSAFMVAMFVTFIVQVFMRYVMNNPLGWTLEASTIAYLWLIFWFAGFSIQDKEHVYFDIFYNAVQPKTRRIFDIITGTLITLSLAITYPATVDYVTFMKVEKTASTQIRFDLIFSIYVIFLTLVIIKGSIRVFHLLFGDDSDTDKINGVKP